MTVTMPAARLGDAVGVEEVPDPQVPERARRRTYTARYKAAVLTEYDAADRDGRGALMRRNCQDLWIGVSRDLLITS